MKFEFKPSFDRSVKALPLKEKDEIKELCMILIDILSEQRELSKGIGLKNLRKNYWEIRKCLKSRIFFRREKNYIEFILAGSHEQIKRYLRNI
jgi:mRNA-degrading endonuclease RelE of RelBE toxin-antitoxin system